MISLILDYAPYTTNTDTRHIPDSDTDGPVVINPGEMLPGERKGPFGNIILPVSGIEKAKIMAENKGLVKRLADYKTWFKAARSVYSNQTFYKSAPVNAIK